MQNIKPIKSPILVFYILIIYVFLQFFWWGYLIYSTNEEIYLLKVENFLLDKTEAKQLLQKKTLMIFGESLVFFIILNLISYKVIKSIKKNMEFVQMQENFFLSITHELNSPITSIKLFLNTILRNKVEKNTEKKILNHSLKETHRLEKLVNNVLIALQFTENKFLFFFEKTNVSLLIINLLEKNKTNNEHIIITNISKSIKAITDKQAILSIFNNIFENAVKYTPKGGKIFIDLSENNNQIILKITDTGYGIEKKEIKNIFKRFYRIENEETRKTKGTGLGLFIVKSIVDKLNGTIKVEKKSIGTEFKVSLPIKKYNI